MTKQTVYEIATTAVTLEVGAGRNGMEWRRYEVLEGGELIEAHVAISPRPGYRWSVYIETPTAPGKHESLLSYTGQRREDADGLALAAALERARSL